MRQLLRALRRRIEREEGFTLIELLVVILIIGILAAVAIPLFLSQTHKAYDANAQSNLKNAQTVVESNAAGTGGTYPAQSTLALLSTPFASDSDATSLSSGGQAVYYYSAGGTSDTYDLCAQGNSSTSWWILVNNGTTYYDQGNTAACTAGSAPGSAISITDSTHSTSGFASTT